MYIFKLSCIHNLLFDIARVFNKSNETKITFDTLIKIIYSFTNGSLVKFSLKSIFHFTYYKQNQTKFEVIPQHDVNIG